MNKMDDAPLSQDFEKRCTLIMARFAAGEADTAANSFLIR